MEENQAAVAEESVFVEDFAATVETAEEAVPPQKKRKHINRAKLQDNIWGWVFCIPLIVGTVWFVYSALIMAIMLSFTGYSIGGPGSETLMEYLGKYSSHIYQGYKDLPDGSVALYTDAFHWYKTIFTSFGSLGGQNAAGEAFKMNVMGAHMFNTVFYMIGIPIGMFLSMFFAVCMSRDIKGGSVFRVLYYIPCVASSISIVYTFKILFNEHGVINSLFGSDLNWLYGELTWNKVAGTNIHSAFMDTNYWCQGIIQKAVIVIMSVWKGLGGTIILYVAGLSGVNAATKEAAQIDGASGWKIFWKVTMPDLYPVIFYNIVTSVIGGMQIYAEPVLLFDEVSGLGSISNTSGYVSLIWKYGLTPQKQGGPIIPSAGAAYGMFLAIIIFVMTLFQFWLDSRKKD